MGRSDLSMRRASELLIVSLLPIFVLIVLWNAPGYPVGDAGLISRGYTVLGALWGLHRSDLWVGGGLFLTWIAIFFVFVAARALSATEPVAPATPFS